MDYLQQRLNEELEEFELVLSAFNPHRPLTWESNWKAEIPAPPSPLESNQELDLIQDFLANEARFIYPAAAEQFEPEPELRLANAQVEETDDTKTFWDYTIRDLDAYPGMENLVDSVLRRNSTFDWNLSVADAGQSATSDNLFKRPSTPSRSLFKVPEVPKTEQYTINNWLADKKQGQQGNGRSTQKMEQVQQATGQRSGGEDDDIVFLKEVTGPVDTVARKRRKLVSRPRRSVEVDAKERCRRRLNFDNLDPVQKEVTFDSRALMDCNSNVVSGSSEKRVVPVPMNTRTEENKPPVITEVVEGLRQRPGSVGMNLSTSAGQRKKTRSGTLY